MAAMGGGPQPSSDFTEVSLPFTPNGDPLEPVASQLHLRRRPTVGPSSGYPMSTSPRGIPLQGMTQAKLNPRGRSSAALVQQAVSALISQQSANLNPNTMMEEGASSAFQAALTARRMARTVLQVSQNPTFERVGSWAANLPGATTGAIS